MDGKTMQNDKGVKIRIAVAAFAAVAFVAAAVFFLVAALNKKDGGNTQGETTSGTDARAITAVSVVSYPEAALPSSDWLDAEKTAFAETAYAKLCEEYPEFRDLPENLLKRVYKESDTRRSVRFVFCVGGVETDEAYEYVVSNFGRGDYVSMSRDEGEIFKGRTVCISQRDADALTDFLIDAIREKLDRYGLEKKGDFPDTVSFRWGKDGGERICLYAGYESAPYGTLFPDGVTVGSAASVFDGELNPVPFSDFEKPALPGFMVEKLYVESTVKDSYNINNGKTLNVDINGDGYTDCLTVSGSGTYAYIMFRNGQDETTEKITHGFACRLAQDAEGRVVICNGMFPCGENEVMAVPLAYLTYNDRGEFDAKPLYKTGESSHTIYFMRKYAEKTVEIPDPVAYEPDKYFDDAELLELGGFRAYVLDYSRSISYDSRMPYEYKTVAGDDAKELYRILRDRVGSEKATPASIEVISSSRIVFVNEEEDGIRFVGVALYIHSPGHDYAYFNSSNSIEYRGRFEMPDESADRFLEILGDPE